MAKPSHSVIGRSPRNATRAPPAGAAAPSEGAFRSRVTAQGQVTLPSALRKALGIRAGFDEIVFTLERDRLTVHRARRGDEPNLDPALGPFLDLLERDIASNPDRLRSMPRALRERMRELARGVRVDYDEPVDGDVAL